MSKKDWVSVDERLPEVGVMVLVVVDLDGCYQYDTDYLNKDQTWHFAEDSRDKVVGWCPIPELPQRILKEMR